jgi:Protein of unknown function (DUF1566)
MKTTTLGTCYACALALAASTSLHAASVSGQGTWGSTLQGRDLDGNLATAEAYYDTSLGITWLADANYAGTLMDWVAANAWASSLNINSITGWRLPTVSDSGTPGCNLANVGTDCGYNVNTATGEMAYMFYTTLGDKASYNTSGVSQTGAGLTNTGPFSNLQSGYYWSGTEYATGNSYAWYFNAINGNQNFNDKTVGLYAWAVHQGNVGVSTVPVPAAVWLFGSGLLGLVGMSGKRRR